MEIINFYDKDNDEKEIFQKLEDETNKYDQKIERNRKFGIHLNPSKNILKRRAYSRFSQLAKRQPLSNDTLEWMGEFAMYGPYDDIRQFFQNHIWVEQYRDMKKNLPKKEVT